MFIKILLSLHIITSFYHIQVPSLPPVPVPSQNIQTMHRLFIRCARMYLYQSHLRQQTNYLPIPSSAIGCAKENHTNNFKHTVEDDLSDIPPYNELDTIAKLSIKGFVNFLQTKLKCPKSRANEIRVRHPEFSIKRLSDVTKNLDLLALSGVTETMILEHPWMLFLNYGKECFWTTLATAL